MTILRIGTRKSQLALWQAHYVRTELLRHHPDLNVELVEIVSTGDRTLDVPLAQVGGKGLFLKELEQSLLAGGTDIAVHSMKDVTITLPPGLAIPVICPRANPHDALVSNRYQNLAQMPPAARLGTCSLRRQCQLRAAFPRLDVIDLRGNVNTRLKRLDQGDFDGLILAAAGLERLDMNDRISEVLTSAVSLPAVGQGAVGIECRRDDQQTRLLIEPLNDTATALRITAERAANAALGGGCHVPIAVYAELTADRLELRGLVGTVDGNTILRSQCSGQAETAARLGQQLAADLIEQGAANILAAVYADK